MVIRYILTTYLKIDNKRNVIRIKSTDNNNES